MKKMIVGLALVVMMVAATGCGTSVTNPGLSQITSGTGETGSVQMRINLYDQGGPTLAAPKRAGGLMRVQDIMKGMTKKFAVYLYEVDGNGNFSGGLTYTSTADVVNGVADILIQNVSAGRSYDVSVNGMDENAQHNFFYSYQKSVLVSADATTIADAALTMVDAYRINNLVLSNMPGNYEVGGIYIGTEEAPSYSIPVSCTFIEQGKASCDALIPTVEISTMKFHITDANSVVHSYTIKVGIRDALDDGRIDFDLASGNIVLTASFPFDVDAIYVDNLTSEVSYAWFTSYGGLPVGIAVGDTLDFIYDDGVSDVVESATVTAYEDGSGYYCKIAWRPQLPQEWWNRNHYSVRKHLDPPFITTNSANSISQNTATLNGYVTSNGASTSAWFEYGATPSLGSYTSSVNYGTIATNFSNEIFNLSPNTTYYYRVVAQNSQGTVYGSMLSFTTSGTP